MTTTTARNFTTAQNAELIREHIQERAEQIHEKRMAARSRLCRTISFLFSSRADNQYNLTPAMSARLYL